MSKKKLPAIISMLLLSGCEPKPGTRTVVNGEIHDVTRPAEYVPITGDATDLYWASDSGSLMTRPHRGGPGDVRSVATNIDQSPHEPVVVIRDGAAFWSVRGSEITIVPKAGPARRVRFDRQRQGSVGALSALHDGETVVWDEVTSDESTVIFFAASVSAMPVVAREVGRTPNTSSYSRTIEPASRGDGFAVTMRAPTAYRIMLFNDSTGTAAPREVYSIARKNEDDEAPVMKLGTGHVFVILQARSSLDTTPLPLVAIPRIGGGVEHVIDPKVCHSLVVIGDDPIYVSTRQRCPGELPVAQRINIQRVRIAEARSETIYAVQTGALWLTWVHGSTMLVDERIPTPHSEGSAPTYDYRTTLLTL